MKKHTIKIKSDLQEINEVEKFVEAICDYYNINDSYFGNIIVAITEAVENAILHGNNLLEQGKGFFSKIISKPKNTVTKIDTVAYEKAKTEIKNRVDSVMAGLFQMGIQSIQLGTKELGEMFYNFYNPDTAVREPLTNFEDVTAMFTKKAPDNQPEATT